MVLGYGFFVGMMITGYYYNLTFVQFGLLDLGTRLIGMREQDVALYMAALAVLTAVVAVACGFLMTRRGWSRSLPVKLRLAFGVVLTQTLLTASAPFVGSEAMFLTWIVVASLALGVGVPATFSMTVDFIPVRDRGYVAAVITAGAYFVALLLSSNWRIEEFSLQFLPIMLAGTVGLAVLAFARLPFVAALAAQHERPEFGRGRFVRRKGPGEGRVSRRLIGLVVVMFGIFFVDSLGFLRLADTPVYFQSAWQSTDLDTRMVIAWTHVLAALVAGVLYSAFDERYLFLWIFGIFALTHLMYTFHARITVGLMDAPLGLPVLYAVAVSLYTVVNFAIWADVSTPETISRNTALGVGLAAWTATFLSTALALYLRLEGVPLTEHLNIVDSLAMLLFLVVGLLLFFQAPAGRRRAAEEEAG